MLPGARPVRNSTTMASSSHDQRLTEALSVRVMGWRVGPDRFIKSGRTWVPRWRFQPTQNLVDALHLLEQAEPDEYRMEGGKNCEFRVRIRIGEITAEVSGLLKPRVITYAIAMAFGIDIEPQGASRRKDVG